MLLIASDWETQQEDFIEVHRWTQEVPRCLKIYVQPWLTLFFGAPKSLQMVIQFSSVQLLSCVQLFVTAMNYSTSGFPVHHQLPEFTQTHVHRVGDAIQPSHPMSSPSPPAPNPSQHQGLLQWVNSSHEVTKVLEFQLQHQSFQWTPRTDLSHEIKRQLLLGRKVMTNLDSMFKSRDITLPTKVPLVKAMVFPVAVYGYESWTIKKAECWRIDAFLFF